MPSLGGTGTGEFPHLEGLMGGARNTSYEGVPGNAGLQESWEWGIQGQREV